MIRKIFAAVILSLCIRMTADAQTGIWSGKLDVQGTELSLVFHLDDENPTVDSPDQGVRGIPAQMERGEGGKITVRMPFAAVCPLSRIQLPSYCGSSR